MKHQIKTGLSFGITSSVVTTVGLIIGLESSTNSKLAVLGGILIIAVADSFSDALGIHMSEESENIHTKREVWESTIYTFFSKFFFTLTFALPILAFDLEKAAIFSVLWGIILICVFNYFLAKWQNVKAYKIILEHIFIITIVIIIAHYVGKAIGKIFV